MTMTRKTQTSLEQHTAIPALSGYLYQLQQAVIRLLELQEGESLGIEILDDLHVQRHGIPVELDQVKYHGYGKRKLLSDQSSELWKTLAIWARAISDNSLALSCVERLVLITRARIPDGSIAELICTGCDPEVIADRIVTMRPPRGKASKSDFSAVASLPLEQLHGMLRRLAICSEHPGLTDTTEDLKRRLRLHGFHNRTLDLAVERLYGWVWNRVTILIEASNLHPLVLITEEEFHTAHCRIRDELVDESLPARYVNASLTDDQFAGQEKKTYVQQLRLIQAPQQTSHRSILAFFRANAERTDWTERQEVLPDELSRYDRDLIDRWQPEFESMCEIAQTCISNEELSKKGLSHLREIERFDVPIRTGWRYKYLTLGSYHILADRLLVGWHPQYHALIMPESASQNDKDGDV